MLNGFATVQFPELSTHSTCEVCDQIISYPDSLVKKELGYSVCRGNFCKNVMSQKTSMAPLLFNFHLNFNKRIIRQRKEKDSSIKQHIQAVEEKEREENQKILQSVCHENTDLDEEGVHLLVIPSGNEQLEPVSNQRVNDYIDHLKSIINEASEYSNAAEVVYDEHQDAYEKIKAVEQRFTDNPSLRTLSDRLCCMCKGGCCASGKEHAYLSVFTMRRYLDEHPDCSTEDLYELYMSAIVSESIEDSCINQTQTGCALPRELRSDICNGYYCDSLKSYQKEMAGFGPLEKVVVVQRSSSYWSRYEPGVENEVVDVAVVSADQDSVD